VTSPIPPGTTWRVTIDAAAFEKLKTEPSFWALVALARALNALRFVHSPLTGGIDDSQKSRRARSNAFLFGCSLVYEASLHINELGQYYRHLHEYSAMVGPFNTPESKRLLNTNFGPVRNRTAFHFGADEIGTSLKPLTCRDAIFVSGFGPAPSEIFYDLADTCAMTTFTAAEFDSPEALSQILDPLMQKTFELVTGFIVNAEAFLSKVLEDSGWRWVGDSKTKP
jgi:hypothetical protein